ncbi:TPA: hypothetical protein DDW35_02060 [Candidatus Sumerlaeota bacterium]|jgi:leader peptidase (prepilin peptidase) / N-methyltransferase|nr:hypothetical protein [Candidatus Sumerlaeota bacterium]
MLVLENVPLFHQVLFFGMMGLLWGSFFNVCVYRMPAGQSIWLPGSYCYHCGSPVRWYDNCPVFAYLFLGGRCRDCKSPFSVRYAIVEFVTGLLFAAVFYQYQLSWAMPIYLVFTGLLLIAALTDIDNWIILDRISLGGTVAGIVFALVLPFMPEQTPSVLAKTWLPSISGPFAVTHWWASVANSVIGAAAGAGFIWGIGVAGTLAFRKPAMGFGDVKLLALIGAFMGWKLAILTIFVASLLGTIWGVGAIVHGLLQTKKLNGNSSSHTALTDEEAQAYLADDSATAQERGWAYSEQEKALLTPLLTTQPEYAVQHRHLPFGPHLALAAWLLMVFGPRVLLELRIYFAPFTEAF